MRILARFLAMAFLLALTLLAGAHIWNSRGDPIPPPRPGALRVATFNVHYILLDADKTDRWSIAGWNRRRASTSQVLRSLDADIIAFQEMESFRRGDDGSVNLARDDLLDALPDHAASASGDWRYFPSTQPIFYRRDRLRLLDQGWFFFSDTPDVIYSRTFDDTWPAFASWSWLEDRATARRLRVVNLHLDFRSGENRLKSARLVADRIASWLEAGEHVVIAGDLNVLANSRTTDILREAGLSLTPVRGSSFHANRGLNLFGPIDHILHDCRTALTDQPVAIRARPDGIWPSDHYPVLAQLVLAAQGCTSDQSR